MSAGSPMVVRRRRAFGRPRQGFTKEFINLTVNLQDSTTDASVLTFESNGTIYAVRYAAAVRHDQVAVGVQRVVAGLNLRGSGSPVVVTPVISAVAAMETESTFLPLMVAQVSNDNADTTYHTDLKYRYRRVVEKDMELVLSHQSQVILGASSIVRLEGFLEIFFRYK